MTPREHYDEAERLLARVGNSEAQKAAEAVLAAHGKPMTWEMRAAIDAGVTAVAQVHATLATVPRAEFLDNGRFSSRG